MPRPVFIYGPMIAGFALAAGCNSTQSTRSVADEEESTVVTTLASGPLELFMENPYLVVGEEAKFSVHLTVLKDGSPIRAGKLTVTAVGPSGKRVQVEQSAPKRSGIFGPVVAFPEAGVNEMSLTLESDQASGVIQVPMTVYADEAAARVAAESAGEPAPEGVITFLKEQAWKIGLVHEEAIRRKLETRLDVPGELLPAAGASAVVTPPLAGHLLPPPSGGFPRVGDRLEVGRIVAVVEPHMAGPEGSAMLADRAQVQTLIAEMGVKIKQAEIEIERTSFELDLARTEVERARALSRKDAIARKELVSAERDYNVAKATHEGSVASRQLYQEAKRDLVDMLTAGGTETAPTSGESPLRSRRLPLRAPISGIVTEAHATVGEYVDERDALFTIIDLDTVWLEALVPESDIERVVKAPAANFTLAAYPGRRFEVLGEGIGRLVDVGSVVNHQTRTLPVRYEIRNPDHTFKIGMFADVAIQTARSEDAVAIPDSALVDEDGRPTAYVLVDGEHFQRRDLRLGIRDSGYVEVLEGIEAGERVVTQGAYAIRLASVSSVIPTHGHTH